MAATLNTGSPYQSYAGGSPSTSISSIAVGATSTWVVAVVHSHTNGGDPSVNTITFNGVGMTPLAAEYEFTTGSMIQAFIYDVSALDGTYTCAVSTLGSAQQQDLRLSVYVYNDGGTPTNWVTDTDTGTTIDIAVTSAANGMVQWHISQDADADLTASGGETEDYDGNGAWYYSAGFHKVSAAGSTTSNITMSSGTWRGVGLYVPEAGGGGDPEGGLIGGKLVRGGLLMRGGVLIGR